MAVMRPPYGNPYVEGSDALPTFQRIVRQEQLFPVVWTIDTQDYLMADNPQGVVDNVIRQDREGRKQERDEVILMHDTHPQDAQALPGVINHFERQGREFVGVNELLADKYLGP
jgi:peptidoglycan/xylan/chitin deacetylase (PgdA/CDA1 family)